MGKVGGKQGSGMGSVGGYYTDGKDWEEWAGNMWAGIGSLHWEQVRRDGKR